MRISDWSSDVCSSDLKRTVLRQAQHKREMEWRASGMGQRRRHRVAAEDIGIAVDREAVGHARDIITDMPVCRAYFMRQARRPVVAHSAGIGGIGGAEVRSEEHKSALQARMAQQYSRLGC